MKNLSTNKRNADVGLGGTGTKPQERHHMDSWLRSITVGGKNTYTVFIINLVINNKNKRRGACFIAYRQPFPNIYLVSYYFNLWETGFLCTVQDRHLDRLESHISLQEGPKRPESLLTEIKSTKPAISRFPPWSLQFETGWVFFASTRFPQVSEFPQSLLRHPHFLVT